MGKHNIYRHSVKPGVWHQQTPIKSLLASNGASGSKNHRMSGQTWR